METASLKFVRYKNKKYTFKEPIPLEIIETPDFSQADEEDQGEWVVENKEWDIRGSDSRSLEAAVIDAEFYFHWDYGRCIDLDNSDITLEDLRRRLNFDELGMSVKDLNKRRSSIIKYRHKMHDKLFEMIDSVEDDFNAPWDDEKTFKV